MSLRWIIISLCMLQGAASNGQQWRELYEPTLFQGMPMRVMKPSDFDPDMQYPVILSLHGAGGRGSDNRRQLKDWNQQLADPQRRKQFPCYVVAPQVEELWDGDDLKKIQALIAQLPSADMNRIYVLGHSMGGHGTYIFIQLAPHYFAAAAPSAGSGLKRTEEFIDPGKIKDIPLWAFHGDQDRTCPFDRDQRVFDEVKRLGGNMKLTIWRGGNHGVSAKMIIGAENGETLLSGERCDEESDFMTWLFSQDRSRANGSAFDASRLWIRHEVVSSDGSMMNSAVASDFDHDGHVDIISSFDGQVSLLRGPSWKPYTLHVFDEKDSRTKPRGSCIHSCLMDVDSDGDLDFCGSNNTVFWLECPDDPFSDGPWKYRTIDDEILGTHCLITGDVNQDGHPDLIANSGRTAEKTAIPNSLTWLEVPDDPHNAKHWVRHVFADGDAPGGSHYTGIADINQDGRPDICCAAKGGEGFPGGEWFAWWEQPVDAEGRWEKHLISSEQPGATNIHPVDINADGEMDFVATRGHGSGVLWFRGPDFKEIQIDPKMIGPHCLVTCDLDFDGDIDIATCGRDSDGKAVWYENDGRGQFSKHLICEMQGAYDIRAMDMDGDMDIDLLIAGHKSQNVIWLENPSRSK
ncbi:MAG: FG-GAP-like repeat-containing protein [Rubripirellula sp.]